MRFTFTAELWRWDARREDWYFASVPPDCSAQIAEVQPLRRGFGGVRVQVRVGATTWRTSVFPSADDGEPSYALPMKRAVRETERLVPGSPFVVHLDVLDV